MSGLILTAFAACSAKPEQPAVSLFHPTEDAVRMLSMSDCMTVPDKFPASMLWREDDDLYSCV